MAWLSWFIITLVVGALSAPGDVAPVDGQCSSGYHLNGPLCSPCGLGTYEPGINSDITCIKCPPGFSINATQAIACDPCAAGSATGTPGSATCTPCAPGYATDVQGQTECAPCTEGHFSSGSGTVTCNLCPLHTFASKPGSVLCSACPMGLDALQPGTTICTPSTAPMLVNLNCGDSLIDRMDIFGTPPTLRSQYLFQCPNQCASGPQDEIWVSADWWYTMDSDVCTASVHAKNISGGIPFLVNVRIDVLNAPANRIQSFNPIQSNGHLSLSWPNPYPVLFQVVGPAPAASLLEQRRQADLPPSILAISRSTLEALLTANMAKDASSDPADQDTSPPVAPLLSSLPPK